MNDRSPATCRSRVASTWRAFIVVCALAMILSCKAPLQAAPSPGKTTQRVTMHLLEAEIYALQQQLPDGPQRLAEQYEWEAVVARGDRWPPSPERWLPAVDPVPKAIREILALEPSEREDNQRRAVADYFRPLSRSYVLASQRLAEKRRELARLRSRRRKAESH